MSTLVDRLPVTHTLGRQKFTNAHMSLFLSMLKEAAQSSWIYMEKIRFDTFFTKWFILITNMYIVLILLNKTMCRYFICFQFYLNCILQSLVPPLMQLYLKYYLSIQDKDREEPVNLGTRPGYISAEDKIQSELQEMRRREEELR